MTMSHSSRRLRPFHLVALSIALNGLTGCGPLPEEEELGEEVNPEISEQPLSELVAKVESKIPAEVKNITDTVAKLTGVYAQIRGGLAVLTGLGEALGILAGAPQDQQLMALKQSLDRLGTALDWKMSEQWRASQNARMMMAVSSARDAVNEGYLLKYTEPPVQNSGIAVNEASADVSFLRFLPETATSGPWTNVMPQRAQPLPDPDNGNGRALVYDWRHAVPQLMSLVAQEIVVLAAVDPSFVQNGRFDDTLAKRRDALQREQTRMFNGIHCGYKDKVSPARYGRNGLLSPTQHFREVACADVHSGTYTISHMAATSCHTPTPQRAGATVSTTCHYDQDSWQRLVNALHQGVSELMPFDVLRGQIDMLNSLLD
jgi:hypothetical protein